MSLKNNQHCNAVLGEKESAVRAGEQDVEKTFYRARGRSRAQLRSCTARPRGGAANYPTLSSL